MQVVPTLVLYETRSIYENCSSWGNGSVSTHRFETSRRIYNTWTQNQLDGQVALVDLISAPASLRMAA